MKISLDGGMTYFVPPGEIRVIVPVPLREDGAGELHVKFIGESMVYDLWVGTEEDADHLHITAHGTYADCCDSMITGK